MYLEHIVGLRLVLVEVNAMNVFLWELAQAQAAEQVRELALAVALAREVDFAEIRL